MPYSADPAQLDFDLTDGYSPASLDFDFVPDQASDDREVSVFARTVSARLSGSVRAALRVAVAAKTKTARANVSEYAPRFPFSPATLFPGIAFDGTALSIPLASLPLLDATETDPAAGDWRKILQSVLLRTHEYLATLPATEAPLTVRVALLEDWHCAHPRLGDTLRRTLSPHFNVVFPVAQVADEPDH
jgi:hypothetical protein